MHSRPHSCECPFPVILSSLKVTATRVGRWKPGGHKAKVGGDEETNQGHLALLWMEFQYWKPGTPPHTHSYLLLFLASPLKTNKRKLKDVCIVCILILGLQAIFHYPNSETKHPSFLMKCLLVQGEEHGEPVSPWEMRGRAERVEGASLARHPAPWWPLTAGDSSGPTRGEQEGVGGLLPALVSWWRSWFSLVQW